MALTERDVSGAAASFRFQSTLSAAKKQRTPNVHHVEQHKLSQTSQSKFRAMQNKSLKRSPSVILWLVRLLTSENLLFTRSKMHETIQK